MSTSLTIYPSNAANACWLLYTSSSLATIFGPPHLANNLFGHLIKGLRRLLLRGGPLAGHFSPAPSPAVAVPVGHLATGHVDTRLSLSSNFRHIFLFSSTGPSQFELHADLVSYFVSVPFTFHFQHNRSETRI